MLTNHRWIIDPDIDNGDDKFQLICLRCQGEKTEEIYAEKLEDKKQTKLFDRAILYPVWVLKRK